jgi:hypothetical protein
MATKVYFSAHVTYRDGTTKMLGSSQNLQGLQTRLKRFWKFESEALRIDFKEGPEGSLNTHIRTVDIWTR